MACTPCQNLFTLIMENKNTYYLLGYDQDMVEETLTLLAEGEKHPERPIITNVMEPVHLLQEKKKGARQARLLNEERKREKVCENKRCSRKKKRHLKKLLKMRGMFFIFTNGYTLCVICGLPEQSFLCGTSFHCENDHGSHGNEIATVIIIYLILHKNHKAIFNVKFFILKKQVIEQYR